jgi:hypothetical protein
MYLWYESESLIYQDVVILRRGFVLWLEVIWGRKSLSDHMCLSERISIFFKLPCAVFSMWHSCQRLHWH